MEPLSNCRVIYQHLIRPACLKRDSLSYFTLNSSINASNPQAELYETYPGLQSVAHAHNREIRLNGLAE